MVLDEMHALYNPWSLLQEPAHPSKGMNASFRVLLSALDQGWRVVEPVRILPAARSYYWTFSFELTNPHLGQNCRLYVPAVPEVEKYVQQNEFHVIEGSYY